MASHSQPVNIDLLVEALTQAAVEISTENEDPVETGLEALLKDALELEQDLADRRTQATDLLGEALALPWEAAELLGQAGGLLDEAGYLLELQEEPFRLLTLLKFSSYPWLPSAT